MIRTHLAVALLTAAALAACGDANVSKSTADASAPPADATRPGGDDLGTRDAAPPPADVTVTPPDTPSLDPDAAVSAPDAAAPDAAAPDAAAPDPDAARADPDAASPPPDAAGPPPPPDRDADGMPDFLDNCPDVANADQADRDGDHRGDACDRRPDHLDLRLTHGVLLFFGGPSSAPASRIEQSGQSAAASSVGDAHVLVGRLLP
jgi:hypothetical protein